MNCQICKKFMEPSVRYHNAICITHYNECIDKNGNKVTFHNINAEGGFVAYHYVNNMIIKDEDGECYIQGVKCMAEEVRLGGIVIQVAME